MELTSTSPRPVRFLVFAASCGPDSLNQRLAELAVEVISANGGGADIATMEEFVAEPYNEHIQEQNGFPEAIERFRDRLTGTDAFIIASPEYNASMPGFLKNSIDWISRCRPQPLNQRQGLLLSASPSMMGGNRGLWALRVPLEHMGARVYPDMFSLAQAHRAFGPDGRLADNRLSDRFNETIVGFMDLVEASKLYPCAKAKWFEYLGERPDPAVDRVQ